MNGYELLSDESGAALTGMLPSALVLCCKAGMDDLE